MKKIICDVCGTDYPETAAQCPICGCATTGGEQTSAGNNEPEAASSYTYVKGGRFSKSNVKKRLKASQAQRDAVVQQQKHQEPDEDDEDEPYTEESGISNKGLIVIVVLLLLAIIAVSSYIALTLFGGGEREDPSQTSRPASSTNSSSNTEQTEPSQGQGEVPCTGLTIQDNALTFSAAGASQALKLVVEPADTTDVITFSTTDPNVAVVDATGRVTAVGTGRAEIVVQCGEFEARCTVACEIEQTTDPSEPTSPSEPTEPQQILELNREDFTLDDDDRTWQLYSGDIDRSQIVWSSDDPSVATVEDGLVTAVGRGSTTIRAKYGDQEATCKVYVRLTEPQEETLELNREEFTLSQAGETWQLYTGDLDRGQITWSSDDPSVATVEDGLVTAVANGDTTIRAKYGDQEVTCKVYVSISEEPVDPEVTLVLDTYQGSGEFTLSQIGETHQLFSQDKNPGIDPSQIAWSISDTAVATVEGGLVTAVGEGKATITATYGGEEFTCIVEVRLG